MKANRITAREGTGEGAVHEEGARAEDCREFGVGHGAVGQGGRSMYNQRKCKDIICIIVSIFLYPFNMVLHKL
jgi:hypothetical protein